jgi:phenylpropionate dioxygenase-like ring-hydroxylating dioxygenase large terminal subunit
VCPNHAWTCARDGQLGSVPLQQGFPTLDRSSTRLAELACEEVAGFVWVAPSLDFDGALDAEARALLAEIEGLLPAGPVQFARSTRDWAANWRILVEGGLESYPFTVAHRQTVGPLFVDTGSTGERFGAHCRQVLPRRSMRTLAERPEAEWRLVEHANVLSGANTHLRFGRFEDALRDLHRQLDAALGGA